MNKSPNEHPHEHREPFADYTKRVLTTTSIVTGTVVVLLFLWYALRVLLLIFTGILLAILLRTLMAWLQKLIPLPDGAAFLAVVLLIVGTLVGWSSLVAPQVATQIDQLTERLPEAIGEFERGLRQYGWGKWLIGQAERMFEMETDGRDWLIRATGVVSTATGIVISVVVVLFVGGYLAVNPEPYLQGILHLVPFEQRDKTIETLDAIRLTLKWWLIGQLIAMSIVGVSTTLGLWALGMPLALVFGLLAFLLDFVPNVGPILAAAPAVLLAFADSMQMGIYVTILYIIVQQLEGLVVVPLVQQRTILLPPVLTVSMQVVFYLVVGMLGLLLATPLTAAILVTIQILYVKNRLGDQIETIKERRAE